MEKGHLDRLKSEEGEKSLVEVPLHMQVEGKPVLDWFTY